MTDIRRFLMLSAATLSMGALISAGCSDDETTASTSTTQSTASSMGGNGSGGMGAGASGGGSTCTPTDECETCAAESCMEEALACCMADGCQDLVRCVGEKCNDAADQQACAIAECPNEVGAAAAAGSTTAATDLGACLTPALENPAPGSACETCAAMFGTGGGGGAGGN